MRGVNLDVNICGYTASTNGAPDYNARLNLQGQVGDVDGRVTSPASTEPRNVSWTFEIANPTAGTRTLSIQVSRLTGTGACRANSGTIITVGVSFW
ncbi:MAG: hypothetical protein ACK5OX_17170 [Desertimonas sp.]